MTGRSNRRYCCRSYFQNHDRHSDSDANRPVRQPDQKHDERDAAEEQQRRQQQPGHLVVPRHAEPARSRRVVLRSWKGRRGHGLIREVRRQASIQKLSARSNRLIPIFPGRDRQLDLCRLRLYETEKPRAVLVGWDSLDEPTYRHEALEAYQAGRVVRNIVPPSSPLLNPPASRFPQFSSPDATES